MKGIILLIACVLVFAEVVVGEQSARPAQESKSDAIQIHVLEDPSSSFHIQVLAPMYLGKEEFEILALHSRAAGEHAMEVGVIVEEVANLMLEGWIHVSGIEELQRYSLHVYYSVPCGDEEKSVECRREYVFDPIDFVDGK